jgi:hypothetical protein
VGEVGKAGKLPRDFGKTSREPDPEAPDDEGDAVDLPFAVEAGGAVPTDDGFALAALRSHKAIVVIVSEDGSSGSSVELAEVHGDVEPPELASSGERVVAAVPDNDAGSSTLTLMGFRPTGGAGSLKRGAQVARSREASSAFDIGLGPTRGLLAWDQWDKSKGHGTIEALSFDPTSLEGEPEPRVVSTPDDDAEAPRIMLRKGGFWLSWVSHGAPTPPARPPPKATAKGEEGTEPDFENVVDVTPRRLKLVPLDERGVPTAEVRLVTAPNAHVLAYDAVPFGDGVLFAWRDDPTTLGAEAPAVHLARVGADGTVTFEVIDDEQVAAGAPRLFMDRDGTANPRTWLALMGKHGRSRLGYLEPTGKLKGPLQDVEGFGLNEPLALDSTRFLLGQPRGQALDLSVVRCSLTAANAQR